MLFFNKLDHDRYYIGAFACVLIAFVFALSWYQYTLSKEILQRQITQKLNSIRSVRKLEIEEYFKSINIQLISEVHNPSVRAAMADLDAAYGALDNSSLNDEQELQLRTFYEQDFLVRLRLHLSTVEVADFLPRQNAAKYLQYHYIADNRRTDKSMLIKATDGSQYSIVHEKIHSFFKSMNTLSEHYDVFLINMQGDIVYSVDKEVDFATNLLQGPHRNSGLAMLFRRLVSNPTADKPLLQDFTFYDPSFSDPAAFAGQLIFDLNKQAIGALVLQMSDKNINRVMRGEELLLGKTGEALLIGTKDQLIRNDSQLHQDDPDVFYKLLIDQYGSREDVNPKINIVISQIKNHKTPISLLKIDSEAADAIRKDLTGFAQMIDYRGIEVFSAYSPLEIGNGIEWGIIVKQDVADALFDLEGLMVDVTTTIAVFLLFLTPSLIMLYNRYHLPIRQLTRLTRNLKQGKFPSPLPINFAGEIAELSRNIQSISNTMQISNRNILRIVSGDLSDIEEAGDLVSVAITNLVQCQQKLLAEHDQTKQEFALLHSLTNEHLEKLDNLNDEFGQQVAQMDSGQRETILSFKNVVKLQEQSHLMKEVQLSQSRSVLNNLGKLKLRIDDINKSLVGYQRILGSADVLFGEPSQQPTDRDNTESKSTVELLVSQFEANLAQNWVGFDAVNSLVSRIEFEVLQLTKSLEESHSSEQELMDQLPEVTIQADLKVPMNRVFNEIRLLASRLNEVPPRSDPAISDTTTSNHPPDVDTALDDSVGASELTTP